MVFNYYYIRSFLECSFKLYRLEENKSLNTKLDADQQSKFYLKFGVKDKLKPTATLEPHQAFIRFTHVKSGRDIVFLAQSTATGGQYLAEVDFATQAKNFRQTSGLYSLELIVSDSLIENPVKWKLGDLNLQLLEDLSASTAASDKANFHSAKPEIKYLFRAAEPVPPAVVSTVFSFICLAPLALLFILVSANRLDIYFLDYSTISIIKMIFC
jgi:oligosaccharyltransferase complex subunit delta (ribophorin II)